MSSRQRAIWPLIVLNMLMAGAKLDQSSVSGVKIRLQSLNVMNATYWTES